METSSVIARLRDLEGTTWLLHQTQHKKKRADALPRPPVIVIAGPTAVGKSAFALELAKLCRGEIISADSVQVYRGMDLGTAKPTLLERREVAHHLIDIYPITEPMNMAIFGDLAREAIDSCLARGKVPLVVGGSGFYLRSLLRGAPPGPSADPFVRAHVEGELERLGSEHLYHELRRLDPQYAQTISHGDRQKIVRAFEIMILSQKKVSDLSWGEKESRYRFCSFFFVRNRARLYHQIERRCDEMIRAGLLAEVRALVREGILENPSAAAAIGYRQALHFLKGSQTPRDYEEFVTSFKQASRRYAKRQLTWFRREPSFEWVDLDTLPPKELYDLILDRYFSL